MVGLYHLAWEVDTLAELQRLAGVLSERGALVGASNHFSTKALYAQDPDGIEFEVPQPTRIVVKGSSKQQVGQVAAVIRKQRPPEPYKGKGIRYEGEYGARKVGKRA